MADRGDVLVARRKLGFSASGRREHFVVVQSDVLTGLDTAVVAPLDDDAPLYRAHRLVVRVTEKEAGTARPQVVLVHLLGAVVLDRFDPVAVGKLTAASMQAVDAIMRVVLEL